VQANVNTPSKCLANATRPIAFSTFPTSQTPTLIPFSGRR
jgi:hypothetical protein